MLKFTKRLGLEVDGNTEELCFLVLQRCQDSGGHLSKLELLFVPARLPLLLRVQEQLQTCGCCTTIVACKELLDVSASTLNLEGDF